MDYITCRDSVLGIIDEASKNFGASFTVTEQSIKRIEEVCDMVDSLASEVYCDHVDVSVEPLSKCLTIGVGCDDLELHGGRSNSFFELIKKVDSFSFVATKNELLKIKFNIYWIWEGVSER